MPSSRILIASNTLSTSAASVTFSSIPGTYTDLIVKWSARSDRSATNETMRLRLNSDTAGNYSWTLVSGNGATASSGQNFGASYDSMGNINAATSTSNTFANGEVYIPNYAGSAKKAMSSFNAWEDNATTAQIFANALLWQGTAAITSVQFSPITGPNFVSGSSFWLYGLKNS